MLCYVGWCSYKLNSVVLIKLENRHGFNLHKSQKGRHRYGLVCIRVKNSRKTGSVHKNVKKQESRHGVGLCENQKR